MGTLGIRGFRYLIWGLAFFLLLVAVAWHVVSRIQEVSAPVSPVSYQEIEAVFAGSRDLTDAQRRDYLDNLRGTKVRWSGTVEAVGEDNIVYVDIDGFLYDVRFPLRRDEALQLDYAQEITFVGIIDQVESYMWSGCRVVLRDVTLQ